MSRGLRALGSLWLVALALSACRAQEPAGEVAPTVGPVAGVEASGSPAALARLLALPPANSRYLVIRDLQALGDAGVPVSRMISKDAAGGAPDGAHVLLEALARSFAGDDPPVRRAGVDLRGGFVFAGGDGVPDTIVLAAMDPALVASLLTTLPFPDSARSTCAAIASAPGYVVCGVDPRAISAYVPGDGEARRRTLELALPGVDLASALVLAESPGEQWQVAATAQPGRVSIDIGVPPNPSYDSLLSMLAPAPPALLRFVEPGTSFMWARADAAMLRGILPMFGEVPASLGAALEVWTGEVLLAGATDPGGVYLRLGVVDETVVTGALQEIAKGTAWGRTEPLFEGSAAKLVGEASGVTVGGRPSTLLSLRVTGSPEFDAVTGALGLSPVAAAFAGEGSATVVLGRDRVEPAPDAEAAVLQGLPRAVSEDLRAGAALAVFHATLDPSHSPAMRVALDAVAPFAGAADREYARWLIGRTEPFTSATLWLTRSKTGVQLHVVVDLIGHTADAEGQAAIAALDAPAADGGPAAAFAALAARYTDSPRITSYRIRGGEQSAGLSGSLTALRTIVGQLFTDVPDQPAMPPAPGRP